MVLLRFFPNVGDRGKVTNQLEAYRNKRPPFNDEELCHPDYISEVAPYKWWQNFKFTAPELAAIGERSNKIAVTATSNERFFSSWKHVIGDRRTRMRLRRQKQCVKWYVNRRMLDKMKRKNWKELVHEYSSDSDECSEDEVQLARAMEED